MSKLEEQKALPRRKLFKALGEDEGMILHRPSVVPDSFRQPIKVAQSIPANPKRKAKKAKGKR